MCLRIGGWGRFVSSPFHLIKVNFLGLSTGVGATGQAALPQASLQFELISYTGEKPHSRPCREAFETTCLYTLRTSN